MEIYRKNPQIRFAILGGDLTENGSDEREWGEFLDAAAGLFSKIPVMPAMGNHDGSMYLKFFALPDNSPDGLKKEFYSFDYGNAHFVMLNSNKNTDETVKKWLREDLQNTDKKWKLAVFHHPPYPVVADYKGIDESIRKNWLPILEQYNVDMVFVGHQHVYMRTKPLRDGRIRPDGEGIVYVMGNSGTKYYRPGPDLDYIAKQQALVSNYQVVEIDGDTLTMTAKGADGQVIDTCTIVKRPAEANAANTVVPGDGTGYKIDAIHDGIIAMHSRCFRQQVFRNTGRPYGCPYGCNNNVWCRYEYYGGRNNNTVYRPRQYLGLAHGSHRYGGKHICSGFLHNRILRHRHCHIIGKACNCGARIAAPNVCINRILKKF